MSDSVIAILKAQNPSFVRALKLVPFALAFWQFQLIDFLEKHTKVETAD